MTANLPLRGDVNWEQRGNVGPSPLAFVLRHGGQATPDEPTTPLSVQHLTKRYGGVVALADA